MAGPNCRQVEVQYVEGRKGLLALVRLGGVTKKTQILGVCTRSFAFHDCFSEFGDDPFDIVIQ